MVDIVATEEALIFDFQTVTTPGPGGKVTGLEAVMQVRERVCVGGSVFVCVLERERVCVCDRERGGCV